LIEYVRNIFALFFAQWDASHKEHQENKKKTMVLDPVWDCL